MEFLKRAENEFRFNVWTVDGRICYCDEVAKKRYILTNFCGFFCYEKHKIESFFFTFGFVWVIDMQLSFHMYLLSFTGNAPLIFYFELIFCFEAVFKNSFLVCSFFFLLQHFYFSYISNNKIYLHCLPCVLYY